MSPKTAATRKMDVSLDLAELRDVIDDESTDRGRKRNQEGIEEELKEVKARLQRIMEQLREKNLHIPVCLLSPPPHLPFFGRSVLISISGRVHVPDPTHDHARSGGDE